MGYSFELLTSYLWICSYFQNESSTEGVYFCAATLFWARVILLLHTYYYWFALMTCGIFKHLCAYGVSRYLYLLWVFFSGCMQMGGWILKWGMGFRAAAIMGGVWNSAIFNFYFSAVSFKYRGSFGFGGILGARLKSTKFWDFPDFS